MTYFPGWVLGYDQRLLLVNERKEDAITAIRYLHRIGFDNIVGYLSWDWYLEEHGKVHRYNGLSISG
jgi:hydroxyacylglutathione hydrolase